MLLRSIMGILSVICAGWAMLIATGWTLPYEYTIELIQFFRINPLQSLAFAILLLVVGIYLLRQIPIKRDNPIILNTEDGELRITEEALKDIILNAISGILGISRPSADIKQNAEGLSITVHCQMAEISNVYEVAGKIQDNVRQAVEQYTGIKVKEVKVLVQPKKPKYTALRK